MYKQFKNIVLVTILALGFLIALYPKVFFSPNSFLFNTHGDALKNYYTYAYYINNNTSNIEFEGMNYPYSEHFLYTDCHPIQAAVLKTIHTYIPALANYSIGLLNFMMLLSIAITAIILYLIFNKLKINRLLSTLGAVAIAILSPQIFRITGHFALSYSFAIPLTIYILLLFEETAHWKYILFLIIAILVFFFTHAYLGMIAATLALMYSGIDIIKNTLKKRDKTQFLKQIYLLFGASTPILLFLIFVKSTDNHIGRNTNPWGIFENHAELSTVFLPISIGNGPMNMIKNALFDELKQTWEGWAYIGIVAIITFIIYIISLLVKKNLFTLSTHHRFVNTLFIASIFMFCLSALWPFRSTLYTIVDYFNIIKQFRALGRFAWGFYFIANILAIFVLNHFVIYLKAHKKQVFANILIVLTPLIIATEGIGYHNYISKEITKSPNLFSLPQTPETFQQDCKHIASDKYQAIIGLPFFYIGSDNFGKFANNDIYKLSFLFSYHLNLPMFNSYLTRTSIPEGKKVMQLLSAGFIKKKIQTDVSDKPILVLYSKAQLNDAEQRFLHKAKLIVDRDQYSLYEIDPKSIFKNTAQEEWNTFETKKPNLFEKAGFLVSDTNFYFKHTDFDTYKEPPFNQEHACLKNLQPQYTNILSIKGSELCDTATYIAKFWIYNHGKNYGQGCLNGMVFFTHNDEWIFPLYEAIHSHEIDGNWSLAEARLSNIDKNAEYKLFIKGDDKSELHYYIDNVLFYDSRLDIYKLNQSTNSPLLWHNNYRIPLSSHSQLSTSH